MKVLLLVKDFTDADKFLATLDTNKIWVIHENQINEGNLIEEGSVDYYPKITAKLKSLATAFESSRILIIVTNMLNYLAVEHIPHDLSVLIYDGSMKRNLFYNISYSTDFAIQNTNDLSEIKSELNKAFM